MPKVFDLQDPARGWTHWGVCSIVHWRGQWWLYDHNHGLLASAPDFEGLGPLIQRESAAGQARMDQEFEVGPDGPTLTLADLGL